MKIFGKLNQLLLDHLARSQRGSDCVVVAVYPEASAFEVETGAHRSAGRLKRIAWRDIVRVLAIRKSNYVGDDGLLLIETLEGVLELVPSAKNFTAFLEFMERSLVGCKHRSQWEVELLAAPVETAVPVYP